MPLSIHIIWAGKYADRVQTALEKWSKFPGRPSHVRIFFWTHSSNAGFLNSINFREMQIECKYYDTEICFTPIWRKSAIDALGLEFGNWLIQRFSLIVQSLGMLLPDALGARASITLKEMIAMWIGGVFSNALVVDAGCSPIAKTVWDLGERMYPLLPCQCYRINPIELVVNSRNPWARSSEEHSKISHGNLILLPVTWKRPDVLKIWELSQTAHLSPYELIEGDLGWNLADKPGENQKMDIIRIDNYAIYNGSNGRWSWFALSYAVYLLPSILRLMWFAAHNSISTSTSANLSISLGYGYYSIGTVISALHHGLIREALNSLEAPCPPYVLPFCNINDVCLKWDVAPSSRNLESNIGILNQFGIQKNFGPKVPEHQIPGWLMPDAQKYSESLKYKKNFQGFWNSFITQISRSSI